MAALAGGADIGWIVSVPVRGERIRSVSRLFAARRADLGDGTQAVDARGDRFAQVAPRSFQRAKPLVDEMNRASLATSNEPKPVT